MKKLTLVVLLVFLMVGCGSVEDEAPADSLDVQAQSNIYPDREWKDINGNRINAHSGSIYYENGFYHWYGIDKIDGKDERSGQTAAGVHLYRSRDLINWNDFGIVLSTRDDPQSEMYKRRTERPKVVYNEATDKYVMFFKSYFGKRKEGTSVAYVGVATADEATGPFTYSHKFRATSNKGSGDPAFFQFPNGDLYHIVVRRSDRLMVMAKMRDDYLYPATEYTELEGIQKNTEGTTIFQKDGKFHLFGSGSGGWDPTAPRYFTSDRLRGPWTKQANPLRGFNSVSNLGTDISFGGQSSFINEVRGEDNAYILMMDVHMPRNPYDSRYIQLPFKVENGKMVVRWQDSWNLGWFGGGDGDGGGNDKYAIKVRARGKSGSERIKVQLNGQDLATFNLRQGWNTFTTSTNERGNLRVAFVNDNGEGRDAYVDWLSVNGKRRQAEAQSGNSAAWGNGRCGGGSFTQDMACNGSINFGGVAKDER